MTHKLRGRCKSTSEAQTMKSIQNKRMLHDSNRRISTTKNFDGPLRFRLRTEKNNPTDGLFPVRKRTTRISLLKPALLLAPHEVSRFRDPAEDHPLTVCEQTKAWVEARSHKRMFTVRLDGDTIVAHDARPHQRKGSRQRRFPGP